MAKQNHCATASDNSTAFTVLFTGYDGIDHEKDFDDLPIAQHEARSYELHGCHGITIIDNEGIEQPL